MAKVYMNSGEDLPIKKESLDYRPHVPKLAVNDAEVVIEKDKQYGASWCKRGGSGAYHVFIRKFDRLEEWVKKFGYDIFKAISEDNRPEGVIDDIRDIRGYLLLVEAYAIENNLVMPRYTNTAPLPVAEEGCNARFNGFVCQKPLGHYGFHHSGVGDTDIRWPENLPPHSGDAHGRDPKRD
jgi:hypothetical protein